MNENDSEHLAGVLAEAGARPAASAEEADLVIVNTCAVREKSEEKLYSFLGRLAALRKNKPGLLVGVAGCVAEIRADALFRRKPGPDFVVGPDRYGEIADIVARSAGGRRLAIGRSPEWHEFGPGEIRRDSPISAFVTVMEGCDNRCAYCVVPFSRGPEKCRPLGRILDEVRGLARAGYREIQLLGQNVDSYRDPDSGTDLAGLLRAVCAVEGPAWVRFLTSHPRNFTTDIIAAMADLPRICRQLHLPAQSGSTAVLERMKRGYARETYLDLVRRLREEVPGIALSTDLIVGFPGETEEDFAASLELIREVRFANLFSFRYSPRPLTEAARLADDVPPGSRPAGCPSSRPSRRRSRPSSTRPSSGGRSGCWPSAGARRTPPFFRAGTRRSGSSTSPPRATRPAASSTSWSRISALTACAAGRPERTVREGAPAFAFVPRFGYNSTSFRNSPDEGANIRA